MDQNLTSNDEDAPNMTDGMYGYVVTDASGSVIEKKGRITNSLDQYTAYFNQLAGLIGDSLGYNACDELLLLGKRNHTICMEIGDLHYGAIFKAKADRKEMSQFLREKGDENDVLI